MNYQSTNEALDLKALQQKDKHTFALLVDQNSDRIYRLALKMVGNEQDAEDILQETFVKAFLNIEGFKGHSKVATWLYRIAINESLMLLRRRKNAISHIDVGVETDNGAILPRQIIDWCCLPEKELMSSESRHEIQLSGCLNCKIVVNTLKKTIQLYQMDGVEITLPPEARRRLFASLNLDDNFNNYG